MPPEKPRIAGELRLRVTSSDDPASFESGSDLLRSNGRPWSRPLHALPKYYNPLYKKLREEQLVPDDLDAILSTLSLKLPNYRQSHLYTLNDTFVVDFAHNLHFVVITEHGVGSLPFSQIFFDRRSIKYKKGASNTGAYTDCHLSWYSYTDYPHEFVGSVLARFERSTLPEHKGTRTIVLRFLKIITPVSFVTDDNVCCPKEGELHGKFLRRGLEHKVWSVNIDNVDIKPKRPTHVLQSFKFLWDT